jgi:hypothetical protein
MMPDDFKRVAGREERNGVPLSDGSRTTDVYSIAISGNDVYVPGDEFISGGHYILLYWKNGTAIPLTDSTHNSSEPVYSYPVRLDWI